MLVATDVGYQFSGGRVLFNAVDVQLGRGESLVIQGPSGSGKSTLLALLGGLIEPTSGTVSCEFGVRPAIGWILQGLNSLGARSVLDNASLYGMVDGQHPREANSRATDCLERVGLAGLMDRRSRSLSGGELQRLAVARAMASDRPLLIADEPTSQLDRRNARLVMRQLLGSSSKENRCVVVATHDLDSVPEGTLVVALTEAGLRSGV